MYNVSLSNDLEKSQSGGSDEREDSRGLADRVEELLITGLVELSSRRSRSVHSLARVAWSSGAELIVTVLRLSVSELLVGV